MCLLSCALPLPTNTNNATNRSRRSQERSSSSRRTRSTVNVHANVNVNNRNRWRNTVKIQTRRGITQDLIIRKVREEDMRLGGRAEDDEAIPNGTSIEKELPKEHFKACDKDLTMCTSTTTTARNDVDGVCHTRERVDTSITSSRHTIDEDEDEEGETTESCTTTDRMDDSLPTIHTSTVHNDDFQDVQEEEREEEEEDSSYVTAQCTLESVLLEDVTATGTAPRTTPTPTSTSRSVPTSPSTRSDMRNTHTDTATRSANRTVNPIPSPTSSSSPPPPTSSSSSSSLRRRILGRRKRLPQSHKDEMENDCEKSSSLHWMKNRSIDCTQECPICWDDFKVGEKVCWSKHGSCRHGFHLDCMLAWLQDHDKCPLCRTPYVTKTKSKRDAEYEELVLNA